MANILFTYIDGITTGGLIVETEAYNGISRQGVACFWQISKTPRTQTMFNRGGIAYVYLCYGIHEMFNIVTSVEDEPHAILVRAIEPTEGIEMMLLRRNMAAS